MKARDYIHQLFHDTICDNIYNDLIDGPTMKI